MWGTTIGVINGDARRLDYNSCLNSVITICWKGLQHQSVNGSIAQSLASF